MARTTPSPLLPLRRLVAALLLLASAAAAAATATPDRAAMMRLAVDRWIAAQADDGSVPYGFDYLDGRAVLPGEPWKYVVRQTAVSWVLARYYRATGDARLREPVARALAALEAHSVAFGTGVAQRWLTRTHLLSLPFARWKLQSSLRALGLLDRGAGSGKVVSPDGRLDTGLTGALALAIIAEVTYAEASGDQRFARSREAWVDALLAMRIPGSGFRLAPRWIDESDYSNGEAWLALALLAQRSPLDPRVAAMLPDLDAAMMRRYAAKASVGFLHWGEMAAAERLRSTGDARFADFLEAQSRLFLDRLVPRSQPEANHCADMEGAAAALDALERAGRSTSPVVVRTRAWLGAEIDKLPRLQVQPGQVTLPLGAGGALTAPRLRESAGDFLAGTHRPVTQVDFTAHCVSALLILDQASRRRAAGGPEDTAGGTAPR